MKHRSAVLLPAKSLSADNVETISLKGVDPISELVIEYKGTNNGSTPTEHPGKLVSKVEVVDGSEVIVSLSGMQIIPLSFYHYKLPPVNGINYINGNMCWVTLRLPFGRWLWDPALALDPARFKNLQLIVTSDLDAGGSAPNAGSLEVVAHCFDEKKITPLGYLRSRQHYTYSLVSSGVETIHLPVDKTIKMLLIQSVSRTKQPWEQYNKLKLSEDNDKKVPYENQTSDLIKFLQAHVPPYVEKLRAAGTTSAVAHYVTPCYEEGMWLSDILATPNYFGLTMGYGGKISIDCNSASEVDGMVHGWCPNGAVAIEFGDPWDYDDWYDLGGVKDLKLEVTAGSSVLSSSTCQIIAEQLCRY